MWLGIYLPDVPNSLSSIEQWETILERKIDLVPIYQAWGSKYKNFQTSQIRQIQLRGQIPLITWEPWTLPGTSIQGLSENSHCERPKGARQSPEQPEDQPAFRLKTILTGNHDDYLRSWAKELNKLDKPVMLRPMHEMNGNWYPWCGTVNNNRTEEYISVWKYLHRHFQEYVQPGIIQWVWSPYTHSYPLTEENSIPKYFPGDSYIDWIALDGYNWGKCKTGSSWQSFEEIFTSAYNEVTHLSNKPLLIGEMASAESGGDKAKWIRDAFKAIPERFTKAKGIVWFNVQKECDWQLNSSEATLNEFKKAIKKF